MTSPPIQVPTIQVNDVLGRISVLQGMLVRIQDKKLRAEMNAEIIKLKQMIEQLV